MSLDDMEPPPADAECPPAERVPEEEIVFEGPIMHEIPEIRQFVEEGGEELTAQDLACLNPSPGGDDVIHPEYDLSIPEVARVAEIVEAADSVIDDDAAKVIEAEDDEIEQILFNQPNMVLEDHTLHNKDAAPKALPKATPSTESRFFSGPAMDSASSALPDSSPSAASSAAGTSRGGRDLKPVAKKAGAKKPRQVTEQWILCDQLEDLPDDHFWMTTPARECLGKKMTFITRGWSNTKRGTPRVHFDQQGSVAWSEFLDALAQIWNGLRMSQVFECLLYGDKVSMSFSSAQTRAWKSSKFSKSVLSKDTEAICSLIKWTSLRFTRTSLFSQTTGGQLWGRDHPWGHRVFFIRTSTPCR